MWCGSKGERFMKYIRMKDSVLRMDTKLSCKALYEYLSQFDNYKNDLVKVADTIEELCDEFVVEDRDEFAIFHNLKLAKQTKGIIYGAIWTDKGLIYVAKMNDKGELELCMNVSVQHNM